MRPGYWRQRSPRKCAKCNQEIVWGEKIALETMKNQFGYLKSFPMHLECWFKARREWVESYYNSNPPPAPVTRRKCADPVTRRKKIILRNYHKKAGHTQRVEELTLEIQEMEQGYIPQVQVRDSAKGMTIQEQLQAYGITTPTVLDNSSV